MSGLGRVLTVFLVLLGIIIAGWIHATDRRMDYLVENIQIMEKKITEKTQPRIQINRATIYNTDGEIVIETRKGSNVESMKVSQ